MSSKRTSLAMSPTDKIAKLAPRLINKAKKLKNKRIGDTEGRPIDVSQIVHRIVIVKNLFCSISPEE